ncbi:potassium-transporting ATPase subunit KdpC [Parabacteroides sp. FAFU027]|uniref:potassium-transporting ATPase subunit KdpC n=1 Tax=Parabacteroides sp. FAFU027 TaxID=2922715 RepID=UPI001FB024A4|nr:potassium-transporting ATPase subunit KdpC [Parabacteroides sp. FAFU027]
MKSSILTSIKLLLAMTILTGVLYPLLVFGLAQAIFPNKANGSLIKTGKGNIGSELIGQKFTGNQYFQGRPSAIDYNPDCSGASNLSITSEKLRQQVAQRDSVWLASNGQSKETAIPAEMRYASGSGLDPHISPESALLQVARVAKARHLSSIQQNKLTNLVKQQIEGRQLGCLGEERVNVLLLNIEVDKQFPVK